jgi:hypothetical protein
MIFDAGVRGCCKLLVPSNQYSLWLRSYRCQGLHTQKTKREAMKGKEKRKRKLAVRIHLNIGRSAPLNFQDSFWVEGKINSSASLF